MNKNYDRRELSKLVQDLDDALIIVSTFLDIQQYQVQRLKYEDEGVANKRDFGRCFQLCLGAHGLSAQTPEPEKEKHKEGPQIEFGDDERRQLYSPSEVLKLIVHYYFLVISLL